jgi:hypothetical protein
MVAAGGTDQDPVSHRCDTVGGAVKEDTDIE